VDYSDKKQVNRRKGICFFIDVNIFMCIGTSQESSEKLKKQFRMAAYISF
jgi:hypothetical protein